MKRCICFLLCGIIVCCSKAGFDSISEPQDAANIRTPDEVISEITELWGSVYGASLSKSNNSIPLIDDIELLSFMNTKSGDSEIMDSIVYLVNFVDDKGFAIVRASKDEEPIVALTDNGNIDLNKLQNPEMFLDNDETGESFMYQLLYNALLNNDYLCNDQKEVKSISSITSDAWVIDEQVEPLVRVKWGQAYPFNKFMPASNYSRFGETTQYKGKMPAGCVMVAFAQMMVTNKMPENFSGMIQSWSMEDLDDVSTYISYIDFNYLYYDESYEEPYRTYMNGVADMLRVLASRFNASYSSSGTGASTSYAIEQLSTFDPVNYQYIEEISFYQPDLISNLLFFTLDCGKPVIIRGSDSNGAGGHAWIIDGYMNRHKNSSEGVISESLVHMNWGWQGRCDGYFDYGIVTIPELVERDDIDLNTGSLINYDFSVSIRFYPY